MPTFAKAIAALYMAAFAWIGSDLVVPLLPDRTPVPWLHEMNAFVGLIMGWTVLGSRAGDRYGAAISHGLTTMVAILFWCLVIWAGYEMTLRSTRLLYDGPMEAIADFFTLALKYLGYLLDIKMIGFLVVGSAFGGVVAEWMGRRSS